MRQVLKDETVVADCSMYQPFPMKDKLNDIQLIQSNMFKKGSKLNKFYKSVSGTRPQSAYAQAAALSGLRSTNVVSVIALKLEEDPSDVAKALQTGFQLKMKAAEGFTENLQNGMPLNEATTERDKMTSNAEKGLVEKIWDMNMMLTNRRNPYMNTMMAMIQGATTSGELGAMGAGMGALMSEYFRSLSDSEPDKELDEMEQEFYISQSSYEDTPNRIQERELIRGLHDENQQLRDALLQSEAGKTDVRDEGTQTTKTDMVDAQTMKYPKKGKYQGKNEKHGDMVQEPAKPKRTSRREGPSDFGPSIEEKLNGMP